jgi:ubiquinone/menaquinone biosynthesis C-methylase UbiE
MSPAHAFDIMSASYDRLWTDSPVGRVQREAFWRHAGTYLKNARNVLDIGCGTGEDAARLTRAGVRVTAIDVSPQMVALARKRSIDARVLPIEQLDVLNSSFENASFDAAISNFGALNCVERLESIREALARLVAPGGYVILCALGRFCFWETAWFLLSGDLRKARRRWGGEAITSSGVKVFYHSVRELRRSLTPQFRLVKHAGIGICTPPSYVRCLSGSVLRRAARVDQALEPVRLFRALADHTLLVFRRVP